MSNFILSVGKPEKPFIESDHITGFVFSDGTHTLDSHLPESDRSHLICYERSDDGVNEIISQPHKDLSCYPYSWRLGRMALETAKQTGSFPDWAKEVFFGKSSYR